MLKKSIYFPSPRKKYEEPRRFTFKQDELVHERARLGEKIQCPVCANTYGAPAMYRNRYQAMDQFNDLGDYRCQVCGTVKRI